MDDRPLLVMLHGWGSTAQVWQPLIQDLMRSYVVITPELPGHGDSTIMPGELETVAAAVWQQPGIGEAPVYLLGWSLGGLVAMQMALQRMSYVRDLLLVAATPCFVQREDWPAAMPADVFDEFEKAYVENPQKALKRFQALQAKGDAAQKQIVRSLGATSAGAGDDLLWGLRALKRHSLVEAMQKPGCRVSSLYGGQDVLVPCHAGEYLPGERTVWPDVGHAPFLSRPAGFVDWLKRSVAA